MLKKLLTITLALTLSVGAFAQDGLGDILSDMLETNGEMYLQPLTDAFGANMNSGFYHRSRVHKMLGFDLSIKAMGAMIPEESQYFDFVLSENSFPIPVSQLGFSSVPDLDLSFARLYQGENTQAGTIFGGEGNVMSVNDGVVTNDILTHLQNNGVDTSLTIPGQPSIREQVESFVSNKDNIPDFALPSGLEDLSGLALPMFMPQASLGLPMGIELTVRGLPEVDLPNSIGYVSALGGGLRVNLDQFIPIPLFPVDITAGAFSQSVKFGADDQEILTTMNSSYSLQVGKSLSLLLFGLGVYGEVAYETSSIEINYETDLLDEPVSFSTSTEPGVRVGGGLHLNLIPLTYIHLGYSKAPTNDVVTAGFGITFR